MIHEAPRSRRQQDNRKRILAAAAEVVGAEGLEGLSVKKVATLANYTPGALYRYFASKDALLAALTVDAIETLAATVYGVSHRAGLAGVVAQANAYRRFARTKPAMYALLSSMNGDPRILVADEESARAIGEAMVKGLVPLAIALKRCADDGLLSDGDARERALLLWSALQGALQLRKQERVAPEFFNAERLSKRMTESLLLGWGARPAELKSAIASLEAS